MWLDKCASLSSSHLGNLMQMVKVLAKVNAVLMNAVLIDCHRAAGTLQWSSGAGLQRLGQKLSRSNRHLSSMVPMVRALCTCLCC